MSHPDSALHATGVRHIYLIFIFTINLLVTVQKLFRQQAEFHEFQILDSFVGFPRPSYEMPILGNDTDNCPELPDKEGSEGNWVGDIMTIAAVVGNSSTFGDSDIKWNRSNRYLNRNFEHRYLSYRPYWHAKWSTKTYLSKSTIVLQCWY